MNSKFTSDNELKQSADCFFSIARGATVRETHDIGVNGIRMLKGILFIVTPEVQQAQNRLVDRTIKLLGAKAGNEKEIADIAWDQVWESLAGQNQTSNANDIVMNYIRTLTQHARLSFNFVAPNYVVRFGGAVRNVRIGSVRAMFAEDLSRNISEQYTNSRWKLNVDEKFSFSFKENEVIVTLPPVCWFVEVTAAKSNVEEEAIWQINVALSLLRLSYPRKQYPLFPYVGDIEELPMMMLPREQQSVILTDEGMSGGRMSAPHLYFVDECILKITEDKVFQSRAQSIYDADTRSLGQRVGQGLGWLTRGREATDRAERFLFSFTAIEALLSSDDKSAPIVQTIARYAAVLLSDEPAKRVISARGLKRLYSQRSALVHAGRRNVSWTDANAVQAIAEAMYWRVLNEYNLDASFRDFQKSLCRASYGLRWPVEAQ